MKTLKQRIVTHIKDNGPMSVAGYMSWALLDPTQGYYPTRDPFGVDGDFITAPEISQMFGEVLGLWLIHAWRSMGNPSTVQLVEYGPGRGVMMADILRTAHLDKDFKNAVQLNLIETSSALEAKQAEQLGNSGVPVRWVTKLEDIPTGPTLIIGNEFLDCLPIRQFIMKDRFKGNDGWHERFVEVDPDDSKTLIYSIAPAPLSAIEQALLPSELPEFKDGDLIEVSPGLAQLVDALRNRFKDNLGAALFIDYGPSETELGDTFQALKKHTKVSPLDEPGHADLTARVDFAHLRETALAADLDVYGACPQGQFLSRLGIEVRAVTLSRNTPHAKDKIARQLHRLTHGDEMGSLFKAIALQSKGLDIPIGFEDTPKA